MFLYLHAPRPQRRPDVQVDTVARTNTNSTREPTPINSYPDYEQSYIVEDTAPEPENNHVITIDI